MRLLRELLEGSRVGGEHLTDQHYEAAYKAIKQKLLDKDEIKNLSIEMSETELFRKTDKTHNSAEFLLNRMHILIHERVPEGESQSRAQTMFNIPEKMIRFAEAHGHDAAVSVRRAEEEMKTRKVKYTLQSARTVVTAHLKDHPGEYPQYYYTMLNSVAKEVMGGKSPEEALAKFKKTKKESEITESLSEYEKHLDHVEKVGGGWLRKNHDEHWLDISKYLNKDNQSGLRRYLKQHISDEDTRVAVFDKLIPGH